MCSTSPWSDYINCIANKSTAMTISSTQANIFTFKVQSVQLSKTKWKVVFCAPIVTDLASVIHHFAFATGLLDCRIISTTHASQLPREISWNDGGTRNEIKWSGNFSPLRTSLDMINYPCGSFSLHNFSADFTIKFVHASRGASLSLTRKLQMQYDFYTCRKLLFEGADFSCTIFCIIFAATLAIDIFTNNN